LWQNNRGIAKKIIAHAKGFSLMNDEITTVLLKLPEPHIILKALIMKNKYNKK